MRRNEILSGVQEVLEALKVSTLYESLLSYDRNLRSSSVRKASIPESSDRKEVTNERSVIFTALNSYSIISNSFSTAAQLVEKILKLNTLTNPASWEKLITSRPNIRMTLDSIRFSQNQLPKILGLLEREYSPQLVDNHASERNRLISVILPEEKGQSSKPQRIIELIDAISKLYEVCVLVAEDTSQEDLVMVACDSGSDKSFDFLGAAKAMESLTNLIISIYDRVVYHREERFARRIELVKEALPVYQSIEQLLESGSIVPEAAEQFKRKLTEGVSQFVESGAIIPEMNSRATSVTPRLVMAPEPKMLRSAPEVPEHHLETENDSLRKEHFSASLKAEDSMQNLSPSEQSQLQKLLEKMQLEDTNFEEEDDSLDVE